MRSNKRQNNQIRKTIIQPHFLKYADSSVLISCGNTKVICSASIEEKVPPHLKGTNTGWVTAEYFMLPRASSQRSQRAKMLSSGRTHEIQRLIGRSLRAITDLSKLGERSIILDCDVIQADGGTRTASISGAFVALHLAIQKLYKEKLINTFPIKESLAAISVGIVDKKPMLDLCYEEDVKAEVDMNVCMTSSGKFVEIQGTGEETTFTEKELNLMLDLAKKGIKDIFTIQNKILK
jgi:ribonuclease PH